MPEPGPRDVLIRTSGAEVGDWHILVREGEWPMGRPLPLVLGLAGAGTVAAIGGEVAGFAKGDPVYAYSYPCSTDNGAWAENMLSARVRTSPMRLRRSILRGRAGYRSSG